MTAVAIAYKIDGKYTEIHSLVVDFGGSHFCATILGSTYHFLRILALMTTHVIPSAPSGVLFRLFI